MQSSPRPRLWFLLSYFFSNATEPTMYCSHNGADYFCAWLQPVGHSSNAHQIQPTTKCRRKHQWTSPMACLQAQYKGLDHRPFGARGSRGPYGPPGCDPVGPYCVIPDGSRHIIRQHERGLPMPPDHRDSLSLACSNTNNVDQAQPRGRRGLHIGGPPALCEPFSFELGMAYHHAKLSPFLGTARSFCVEL